MCLPGCVFRSAIHSIVYELIASRHASMRMVLCGDGEHMKILLSGNSGYAIIQAAKRFL